MAHVEVRYLVEWGRWTEDSCPGMGIPNVVSLQPSKRRRARLLSLKERETERSIKKEEDKETERET